jgi:subtilisin family serine protease
MLAVLDADADDVSRTYAPLSFFASGINGVGIVSPSQGAYWLGLLSQGSEITVNIIDPSLADILYDELENYWTGGTTSEFTSWGPSWELVSKPQFTAPGENVLAPYPLAMGRRWNIFGGTSSSAPLTAAVFALVGQARGTLDPKELSSVISSTSKPLTWFDGEAHLQMGPVPQQGAGMVQAHDASVAKTVLSATQLSFNDTDNFIATRSFSIRNTGNTTLVYTLGSRDALTVNTFAPGSSSVSRFPPPVTEAAAVLSFSDRFVALARQGTID